MEWVNELKAKYPNVCNTVCDCFVEDGWVPLVQRAFEITNQYNNQGCEIRILQVKEKFAKLRIYANGEFANDEMANRYYQEIKLIEDASLLICEYCGSEEGVGIDQKRAWIKSLCRKCEANRR